MNIGNNKRLIIAVRILEVWRIGLYTYSSATGHALLSQYQFAMRRVISGLVAFLLILPISLSTHAQGKEWKKLNGEVMSLYRQGHYDQAVATARRALQVAEKAGGPDHLDVAMSLNTLAELYRAQGQNELARSLHARALIIRERALGPEHPLVAASLNNLAESYLAQGQEEQAGAFFRRALAVTEKIISSDHPLVATSMNSLAMVIHQGMDVL